MWDFPANLAFLPDARKKLNPHRLASLRFFRDAMKNNRAKVWFPTLKNHVAVSYILERRVEVSPQPRQNQYGKKMMFRENFFPPKKTRAFLGGTVTNTYRCTPRDALLCFPRSFWIRFLFLQSQCFHSIIASSSEDIMSFHQKTSNIYYCSCCLWPQL